MSDPAASASVSATGDRSRRPGDDFVDAGATLVLTLLGLVGLQHAYGGFAYMVAGAVAALAGTATVLVLGRLKVSPLVWVVALAVVFVAAGGVAVPDEALMGVIPTPGSLSSFFGGLGSSWTNLLTTAPPIGVAGGLGVAPYVCGFVGGAGGMALARQTRLSLVPAAPAAAVLLAGLVFGTRRPVSVIAQGALFAGVALVWGAIRANRSRRAASGSVHWPRALAGAAMVALVMLIAVPAGSWLPGVDTSSRFVLRERTEPPFDPRNEPSPLAAFRDYVKADNKETTMLTVAGLPEHARIRLATMDTYDGVVWIVGGPSAPASGRFERVGSAIEPVPPGQMASVTVRSDIDRKDVWLPTVGATETVSFEGGRSGELDESFRYNRETGTGALPTRLASGDTYLVGASVPAPGDESAARSAIADPTISLPSISHLPDVIAKRASELTLGVETPFEQARALETRLREGYFSNGDEQDRSAGVPSPPGHSIARLVQLLNPEETMVGNAEQYAAAMALMARSLGLPARVVMGFVPDPAVVAGGGEIEVKGGDASAWVEVAFADQGWVTFDPTPDEDRKPQQRPRERPQEQELAKQEPPPPAYLDPPDILPQLAAPPEREDQESPGIFGFEVPRFVVVGLMGVGIPALVIAAIAGLIVGLKALRRQRRRTRGTPVDRLGGAWRETCDQVTDLGGRMPKRATRLEVAESVSVTTWTGARPFAERVDAVMFGPNDPDETSVTEVWELAEVERKNMVATLDRKRRVMAALNLRSLQRIR